MSTTLQLKFAPFGAPAKGVLIVFCEEGLKFGAAARKALAPTGDLVTRAAASERFQGKSGSTLDILAPAGLELARLVVVGSGKVAELKSEDFVKLGGIAMGKVSAAATDAQVVVDLPGGAVKPERAADLALGVRLRAYSFDRYKTRRKDDEDRPKEVRVALAVAGVAATQKAYKSRDAVANGVVLARISSTNPPTSCFPRSLPGAPAI